MPGPSDEPSILDARLLIATCVLFPVWSCDLLLTAQEVGIVQSVIASPEIIDEARRNALDRYPDGAAGIAQRFAAVSRFVEGGRGPGGPIEIDDLELINEKDLGGIKVEQTQCDSAANPPATDQPRRTVTNETTTGRPAISDRKAPARSGAR